MKHNQPAGILFVLALLLMIFMTPGIAMCMNEDQNVPAKDVATTKDEDVRMNKFFKVLEKSISPEKQISLIAKQWSALDELQEKEMELKEKTEKLRDELDSKIKNSKDAAHQEQLRNMSRHSAITLQELVTRLKYFDQQKDFLVRSAIVLKERQKLENALNGKSLPQAQYNEERNLLEFRGAVEEMGFSTERAAFMISEQLGTVSSELNSIDSSLLLVLQNAELTEKTLELLEKTQER